ncbi:unnamed protein product [Pseudo-nitzschia multistriata]|uniref:Tetratricopeptide SHNi-TPR domain-containing protein n=1 Tax=Pseudo-nitzschia multistriata TaxID=183589 RepID=A0A448Z2D2_9STRA|nr:unnamed protein product [Pseudo-nitzschia multistriata]
MTKRTPVVTRDPRFLAGRKLVERGLADEAITVYGTLLEETTQQYGDASVETAPAYYEYGNSLLRAAVKQQQEQQQDETTSREEQRSAAAAAAEHRQQSSSNENTGKGGEEAEKKPAAVDNSDTNQFENDGSSEQNNQEDEGMSDGENDNLASEDLSLALEMMENSFSILEEYKEKAGKGAAGDNDQYSNWVSEQLPRILLGLGDTLSTLNRHADAADAYSRALELRKACLQEFEDRKAHSDHKQQSTIEHLKAHRMVCEANILIAEALLSCPPDKDVVTTETQSLIVKANERVSYARGYYDQARDALQEAVVFMGDLPRQVDLGREKEDVCFLATLVMGVGESLATIDEQADEAAVVSSTEPVKKKAKRGL